MWNGDDVVLQAIAPAVPSGHVSPVQQGKPAAPQEMHLNEDMLHMAFVTVQMPPLQQDCPSPPHGGA